MRRRPQAAGFIVGPLYDCVFFLFAPVIALLAGVALELGGVRALQFELGGVLLDPASLFIGSVIAGHLVLVLLRSHLNSRVFARHPWRFIAAPLGLLLLMYASASALVTLTVLAIWWDVYHSSMQTFGLGRIYDQRAGQDPASGRGLDRAFNLLVYAGPILAGATLMSHAAYFESFERVGLMTLAELPARIEGARWLFRAAVGVAALGFVGAVVRALRSGALGGYRCPPQKLILYLGTAVVSIVSWGFNSFGEAFFIMNLFHAQQYFGLVWWSESGRLSERCGAASGGPRRWLLLAAFVLIPLGYGLLVTVLGSFEQSPSLFRFALLVSLLHFWYDGFIWSVRRGDVASRPSAGSGALLKG